MAPVEQARRQTSRADSRAESGKIAIVRNEENANDFPESVRLACGFAATGALALGLTAGAQSEVACDPDNGGLKLPRGSCALVAADGLGTGRHLAVAPNGDV